MLFDEILTEFKEYSEKKKNQKKRSINILKDDELFKLLASLARKINKIYQTNKESFYKLIGQMIEIDAKLSLASFIQGWGDNENTQFLVLKTIMERYFLLDGEKFLKGPFLAYVNIKGRKLLGNVRITSHRLLISGSFIKSPNVFGIGHGLTSLVTLAIESGIRAAVRTASEKKIKSFKEANSERLDECELMQIPIFNPRNIKKKKGSFSFDTTFDIKKKNKVKSISMSIKIEPVVIENGKKEEILQFLENTITPIKNF
ncbi:MAG: hypothetical protein ACFFAF_01910 [Candidatus Hermodarchaeota archaeon]